jgi:hypothetical protein
MDLVDMARASSTFRRDSGNDGPYAPHSDDAGGARPPQSEVNPPPMQSSVSDHLSERAIRELAMAVDLIRHAQKQLAETRNRIEALQRQLAAEQERYEELLCEARLVEPRGVSQSLDRARREA